MLSRRKYFGDRGGPTSRHGDFLQWPGTADGFPIRGPAGDLKQHEFEDIPHVIDYRSDKFKLWVAEDKKRFDDIMDRIANGLCHRHNRIDKWNDEHEGLLVWLEWFEIYGDGLAAMNPQLRQGSRNHDATQDTLAVNIPLFDPLAD
jgi:hypothetical protein